MRTVVVVAAVLMVGAGVAYGAWLGVPWFVDNAPAGSGNPPTTTGQFTAIFLHNNTDAEIECSIEYFTEAGVSVGPAAPGNTFVIPANASVAFRPGIDDPASVPGGQEGELGAAVPNRPLTGVGNDGKKNGSCVITWVGDSTDVQGFVRNSTTVRDVTGKLDGYVGFGYLLPSGTNSVP